ARLVLLPCNSQLPSRHRVHTNAVLSHLVHVHLSNAYLNKKHSRLFAMHEPSLTHSIQVLTLFDANTFPFPPFISLLPALSQYNLDVHSFFILLFFALVPSSSHSVLKP